MQVAGALGRGVGDRLAEVGAQHLDVVQLAQQVLQLLQLLDEGRRPRAWRSRPWARGVVGEWLEHVAQPFHRDARCVHRIRIARRAGGVEFLLEFPGPVGKGGATLDWFLGPKHLRQIADGR